VNMLGFVMSVTLVPLKEDASFAEVKEFLMHNIAESVFKWKKIEMGVRRS